MRKLTSLLLVAGLITALTVGATALAATKSVSWKVPSKTTVKIKRGSSVKWVWADREPHNVKGPGFRSKTVTKRGYTYTRRFRKRGTFRIICEVHPTTMKTKVVVG
jgi:plastocyanin